MARAPGAMDFICDMMALGGTGLGLPFLSKRIREGVGKRYMSDTTKRMVSVPYASCGGMYGCIRASWLDCSYSSFR